MPLLLAGLMLLVGLIALITGALTQAISTFTADHDTDCATGSTQQTGAMNTDHIPTTYLRLYQQAGQMYGIPWPILAAIGRIESSHGTNISVSRAGARGPMQFMPTTWNIYGLDGNGDGIKDIENPADAIPAAAHYLKSTGAPRHLRGAIFAYNHSSSYVTTVLRYAREYDRTAPKQLATETTKCELGPAAPPGKAAAIAIAYAKAQLGTPYVYGGTCTNPKKTPSPTNCDCSSLIQQAYAHAGITIPRTSDAQYWHSPRIPQGYEAPGDLVFFDFKPGHSGPAHVGIVYNVPRGLMIAAPHTGTNVRIQNYRNYPGGPAGFVRPTT